MRTDRVISALRIFSLSMIGLATTAFGFAQGTPATPPVTSVNLSAQRMSLPLPDGKTAPMWGYCTTPAAPAAACTGPWTQGPTIVVPSGNQLTINLTNNLPTPTSIVILGQTGGGLGAPVMVASPDHSTKDQTTSWPVSGPAAVPFTPPTQGKRVQSFGSETAPGATGAYAWTALNPGTYLYETGTHPSIQAPMGLYGVIVVTKAPDATTTPLTPGQAYTNVAYDADAVILMSEIDLGQNTAVDKAASAAVLGNAAINPLDYPPAINYAPTYFLMNGQPFSRSNPSSIQIPGNFASGNVLLRFVNAGLKTHVPSVVGLNMQLIAEDGNVLPGNHRIQSEVLLPAGKTYDVLVNPPSAVNASTSVKTFVANAYGVFDRQLSLSAGNFPDSGMQTFLQVNGGALPAAVIPTAVADTFSVPSDATTFTGNVLKNDIAVFSAAVSVPPSSGSVTLNLDGSFTFSATGASYPVSFSYCGNGALAGTASLCASVTLTSGAANGAPTALAQSFTSRTTNYIRVSHPGVLAGAKDPGNLKMQAQFPDPKNPPAGVTLNADGSFVAVNGVTSFTYVAVNSQGLASASATVNLAYPTTGTGLKVNVLDALTRQSIGADYRWTIEEDTTYKNDAQPTTSGPNGTVIANTLALNFHKSFMPVVATGCVGPISCGAGQTTGNGATSIPAQVAVDPSQVQLDPTKHYFIDILPGDAVNAFASGNVNAPSPTSCTNATGANICGHTMGGSPFGPDSVSGAFPTSVDVLVEPNPLQTAQLSVFIFEDNNPTNGDIDGPEESQGLGGFQIIINDVGGRTGDPVGQMTYDAFNMPLTNALMGTYECPFVDSTGKIVNNLTMGAKAALQGAIITCPSGIHPKGDGVNAGQPYALAGQALIKNLMPGRFDVLANPGAAREQAGETWYQVSTLEGTRGQDAFAKVGEPAYFQEFGPPGFHTFIGFVNPDHVNKVTNPTYHGTNTVTGSIVNLHMARPVNENLYAGNRAPLSLTTCFVSLNASAGSGENMAFAKCDQAGNYSLSNVPPGIYQMVAWDEWLDQIIAYKNVTVPAGSDKKTIPMGPTSVFSWFTRVETNTYLDDATSFAANGKRDPVPQVPVTIRFRDGSISNILKTDASGNASFNELFPLFNWYVAESDQTRFTGDYVHVVVDGGGQPDSAVASDGGDYTGILHSTYPDGKSTIRDDPGTTLYEGLQGFVGQTEILNWAKRPYNVGENGGISGTVVYASTRPFDDPRFGIQNVWSPLVPRVQINLYQENAAADGSTSLKLVNSTLTSSWDDYVSSQGQYARKPMMSCPGQVLPDPFVSYTLGSSNLNKCYDGFHMWNQVQPAVYDGRYQFITDSVGAPLPPGKYVVEMVLPDGYEVVKEEDKNILMGDAFVAPVAQQFGGLSNIFILPDQANVANPTNANNSTIDLGHPTGGNNYPACVGALHRVPDYMSLFPLSGQVAPFANADRPLCDKKEVTIEDQMQANSDFFVYTNAHIASHFTGLILDDAASEINAASPDFGEKFAVPFVPISIKDFNGIEISRLHADQWGTFNGLTPSSWQVNVPNPSGYSPNMLITCMNDPGPIPDPANPGQMITDPAYNPMFSNFCYTNPFMPGLTDYLDTPLLPVAAFAAGYNPVDCAYPDATPAIKRVDSSAGIGPYLPSTGGTLTITALGKVTVRNPAYAGPSAATAPGNQLTITRTYNFGPGGGLSKLTIGNTDLTGNVTSWSSNSITVRVPEETPTGQLVITNSTGVSSTDAVTVTIDSPGVKSHVLHVPGDSATIQGAIDKALPGDLILIDAGTYNELVVMDKPVRLQGVGAASVIINAAKYPTTKLADWRPRINADFGIDANGNQLPNPLVDPLPGQEITGGIVLLEPSVLSTEEGAGITVLAKNLGTTRRQCTFAASTGTAYNFACYTSRIDGISVTGGDAGGGVYVNGWAHNLEIANNRVFGNAGAFNGGIRVGIPYLEGLTGAGYGFDVNVKIHNNAITTNGTVEANAGSSGAGGGLSMCAGSDNYQVTNNYICGNYSMSDGGGIGHIGVSLNGLIKNNKILFNQSYNQGTTVHGGGIVVEGESPAGAAAGVTLGTGDVTIDSNLIQGNFAEAGSGGGIRLQGVNGDEISRRTLYKVTVQNNMIVNNVAGWAGGGISLADTFAATIRDNTIANNDSVSIAGPLFGKYPTTTSPNPAGISTEPTSPGVLALLNARNNNLLPAANKPYSNPADLTNNIIWKNRSFYFDLLPGGVASLCPSSGGTAVPAPGSCKPLPQQASMGDCPTGASYWDLGVAGDLSAANPALVMNPTYSVLTDTTLYGAVTSHNQKNDPALVSSYCNGTRGYPGQVFEPGQPFLPPFAMTAAVTLDEAGNFVDVRYGPLSVTGNYAIGTTSPAKGTGNTADYAPRDIFGTSRGPLVDIGAVQLLPALTLTPTSIAFGNVQIGQIGNAGGANVATLSNVSSQPVTVTSIGGLANGFNETDTCSRAANGLPAAGTCRITITFNPTIALGAGAKTATLTVQAGGQTLTVALTATAVAPSGSIAPNPLAFGNVQNGQTSIARIATLTNNGIGPLTVNTAGFTGGANQFSRTGNTCTAALNPGASCTFTFTFSPTAGQAASHRATYTVTFVSGGSAALTLTGTGTPAAATITPNPLSFAATRGTTSAAQTVTLTNTGNGPIPSVGSLTGTGAGQFAFTTTCGATLAAGRNCSYSVTFKPPTGTSLTSKTASLTVAGAPVNAVVLNGTPR